MNSSPENDREMADGLLQGLEMLEDGSFFSTFPVQVRKLLSVLTEKGVYSEGDVVIGRGDDPGLAFYVISGEIAAYAEGSEVPAACFTAGQFIGCLSLLGSLPSLFTLKAVQKTEVLLLSRDHFLGVLEQFPEQRYKLPERMVRLVRTREKEQLAAGGPESVYGVTLL